MDREEVLDRAKTVVEAGVLPDRYRDCEQIIRQADCYNRAVCALEGKFGGGRRPAENLLYRIVQWEA